mgnify:CR=1 FL=1
MWKKINHGGEPTKNIDKKHAIFVGRYQPYHFGHIELIKQKLNQESAGAASQPNRLQRATILQTAKDQIATNSPR